jgi:hypothetical protein
MVKDKTPLPRIDDMIDTLVKGRYYTKMDIIWGYNNIRIKEGHEWKATFLTPRGLFEPTVMYFGLCNSPGTFMRMMATIFRDMIHAGKCAIYMDDIVFCGKTREELRINTLEGLQILEQHDLYVKESKCYWEVEEVPVLGHIVGHARMCMEKTKIKTILEWRTPKSKNDVHVWNGFCNFYCQYIKGYSSIAKPLTRLLGNTPFEWGPVKQKAFEDMKELVVSEPVIAQPLPTGVFHIEVDASGFTLGGVLSQHHPDGKWHPVTFISRVMSPAELNYNIYDKELLAIMYVLDEWRPYLLHASEPFEIWTDHKNLAYFRQPQKLNGRQACWYSRLQEYNYTLRHIPGATNSKADILSRLPWYKAELLPPNDVTMLPETRFVKRTTQATILFSDKQFLGGGAKTITIQSNLEERIRQNQQKETKVIELEKQKLHLFSAEAGLMLFEG